MKRCVAWLLAILSVLALSACGGKETEPEWAESEVGSIRNDAYLRLIEVTGASMNPTLYDGEQVLTLDLFYKPQAGDVIAFRAENYDPGKILVKRVIATEGQEVSIDFEKGVVFVDGEPLDEPYTAEPIYTMLDYVGPQTVPTGCVFVLGDNRNASNDSRTSSIGMVDEGLILGKVFAVASPEDVIRPVR
jgi:signal peptidase I